MVHSPAGAVRPRAALGPGGPETPRAEQAKPKQCSGALNVREGDALTPESYEPLDGWSKSGS